MTRKSHMNSIKTKKVPPLSDEHYPGVYASVLGFHAFNLYRGDTIVEDEFVRGHYDEQCFFPQPSLYV